MFEQKQSSHSVFVRRRFLASAMVAAGALAAPAILRPARAAGVVNIRYATGGGIGPNEMETIIYLDYLKKNVLKNYGKSYTLDITFTQGTPEAAQLLSAGQADLATLSFSALAVAVSKGAVPDGLTIISDNYQDGHAGYATKHVLRQERIADQNRCGPSRQDGRGQRVWLGRRPGAPGDAEKGQARSAA